MKKIDKPGCYDLTMDEYHGDCCDGPSVSASVLHKMNSECPAIVWEASPLNPNRVEDKSTKALDIGKAAHALVLGEPEFNANFVVLPEDVPNRPSKRQRNAKKPSQETLDAIDLWDGIIASKKTIVAADAFQEVVAMAAAQKRSPQVARAFESGKPEQSLIWRDAETGIWLKSRPDWLPNDPARGWIVDYKSARTIHPRKLSAAAFEYGYHLQSALQCDGVKEVFGVAPLGVAHVCQDKSAPYLAELKMFDVDQLKFGRLEYRRALKLFARCWEAHLAGRPERVAWPGFTVDPQYYETPYYIRKTMESPDELDRYASAGRAHADASEFYAPT